MPKRLPQLPKRATPGKGFDYSFLSDGQPWLLVRGLDFEPEVTLATVRRRIRDWAGREGYTPERGYVVETRTVEQHPSSGKDFRDLTRVPARDRRTRPEYGVAVRLVKDPERASRRLRRHGRS